MEALLFFWSFGVGGLGVGVRGGMVRICLQVGKVCVCPHVILTKRLIC